MNDFGVIILTISAFVGLFLISKLFYYYQTKNITEYIKGYRNRFIKLQIPECIYEPEINKLSKRELKPFYSGYHFYKALGHFSFNGKYKNVHIEDMMIEYIDSSDSGSDDCYYETILMYLPVPEESIFKDFNLITFSRTDTIGNSLLRAFDNFTDKMANKRGVTLNRQRPYILSNSMIQVTFDKKATDAQISQWINFFENGNSEKIVSLLYKFGVKNFVYSNNKLFLCAYGNIGKSSQFNAENDYFLNNLSMICDTVAKLNSLVYPNNDEYYPNSAIDVYADEYHCKKIWQFENYEKRPAQKNISGKNLIYIVFIIIAVIFIIFEFI